MATKKVDDPLASTKKAGRTPMTPEQKAAAKEWNKTVKEQAALYRLSKIDYLKMLVKKDCESDDVIDAQIKKLEALKASRKATPTAL